MSGQNIQCKGKNYVSDTYSFKSSVSVNSLDNTTSKKKAMMKIRNLLTQEITNKCNNAIFLQSKLDDPSKHKANEIIQMVIRQSMPDINIICEDVFTKNNKCTCNLVVEITKNKFVQSVSNEIKNDSSLKEKFDIELFTRNIKQK